MKLDPRIKSLTDILTCFDIEEAKQFIGQKGYFSDFLSLYDCLDDRTYDVLTKVDDNSKPFKADLYWRYFIPESRLLEVKKKKYRPYTMQEFKSTFTIGQPIKHREKGMEGYEIYVTLLGYRYKGKASPRIYIGNFTYSLDGLFVSYEWQDPDTGDWKPFGVEED